MEYDRDAALSVLRRLWDRYADSTDRNGRVIAEAVDSLIRELEETPSGESDPER